MFFVNLIYGHFDILRFQNGRIKKVALFQVCAIVVLQLHTARKEDPITPQTHLGASISLNTTQIPPIYPPDISREVKMSTDNIMPQTDTSRHTQTAPDSVRGCLVVSLYVCWHLFSSLDFLSSLDMSGGERDVWVRGGVYGYLSGIHGNIWWWDVFGGYLCPPSLQYGTIILLWHRPEKAQLF